MKNTINLTFNISPVPASRPRVTRWGTFYGKKYKEFKREMGMLLIESDKTSEVNPVLWIEGLISADMTFFVPMAKSWSKKKKLAKESKYADNNVDIDNLCKEVLDGLEGRYYFNDNQIVMIRARKYYSNNARVEFELLPIEETT